jgi:predicted permease
MSLWTRVVNAVRGDRLIDEIDEELESHLAEAAAHGRDPDEARRAFGPRLLQREASYDVRRLGWLGDFVMDVRYGARVLRGQPAFLSAAVLSLGLGIGATAAIFSVMDAVMLRPLPVAHPDQLVAITDRETQTFSYPDYLALRRDTRTLSDLVAAASVTRLPADIDGGGEQILAKAVSGSYFLGLGVAPAAGRLFGAVDELEPVAVLSDAFWLRRFDRSPAAIGRTLQINGVPFSIVGVAAPGFDGEAPGDSPDLFATFALQPREVRDDRGFTWLSLLGRLRPGATADHARADLGAVLVQARPTAPSSETQSRLVVGPGAQGISAIRRSVADPLRVLMALAGTVLLVTCTNLAGLLLTRAAARHWEIAMRLAIGASRIRVLRQLLTESLLLAAAGGALGVVFALWGSAALVHLPIGDRPIALDVGLNLRVLAFTAAISIAAGLLFGFAPAWRAVRDGAVRASTRVVGSSGVWNLRGALIIAQVALSLVLLGASVMFSRTLTNLESQDLGFRADHVLLVPILRDRGYRPRMATVLRDLLARVTAVPGVSSASVALGGTLNNIGGARVQVEGSLTHDRLGADWVGPGYIHTAGMTLVAGRDFSLADDDHAERVVVVNETMARRYFGPDPALGRRVTFNNDEYTIVGVVKDAKYADLREVTQAFLYFPTLQTQSGMNTLEVRTADDAPATIAATIGPLVHEIDPHLTAGPPATLADRIDRRIGAEHVVADLAGVFGMLTLALLSVGIYGTLSYASALRTREIGLRLALGAPRAGIVWIILKQIVVLVTAGEVIGTAGVLVVARLVKPLLFGIAPTDPWTIVGASMLLVAMAAPAAGLPARAAARLDPAAVLRE